MQAKSGSIAEIVTKTKETAEKAAQQQAEIKKNAKASKVNIKELAPSAGKWSVDPKIDMDTLTTKQTAAVSYLKAVSEVSGMNITLMSGVDVTGAFSVENGHYDGVTNTLYVSVNAGMQSITDITGSAILKTASHEITHYIAASGTQTYSLLEDYVLSRFTEQYGEKSVDNRIEDIQEQYKDQVGKELTREQAKEEMVAAACEMMLKNSEVFEKLARQNLTLAQRIKAGLDGFVKKLSANRKAAFENLDATSPEARAIAASEASLKETQKLWDNALKGAIKENEGGKSAGTGSMYELRGYSEKEVNNWANSKRIIIYRDNIQLKEFVNEALNNKNYDRKMYFGKIPANLAEDIKNILSADIDVEGYNCTLDSYHIRKINAKHGNEVNERLLGQRGVTVNDYETIPSVISNPDSLTDQGLYNGKPAIGFVKYINGEKFTVIGVISDKHMDLFVQTSYIGAKKGSLATRASEKTDTITPEARRGTAPDNNIADSADAVNTVSPDIRYQLREVTPVEPSSEDWTRSLTTAEAKKRFPDLWDVSAEESDTRNPTQVKITESSYRKIYDILKQEGFDGTILDASSGLGHGTRVGIEDYGFKVDDIEPYPSKDYSPKYTDYSKLDKTYDAIISNAVLNVLPQDQRDALVVKMGQMLNPGGQMFINVRGDDVLNASSKEIINRDNLEVYITKSGSYQKGFTRKELVAYLQDALGDGYTVRADNRFGKVSAVVTKAADTDVRFELRDNQGRELTKAQAEKFKDSQVRDNDGRLKTVYHGSSAVFNVFSADFMSQHGSSEGQGFYFTDYKDMAEGYQKKGGQLLEGYLNITNPLSDSEVTLSAPEVKRLLKALDPTGDDVILNYDSQGGMGYPSKAWYNRALADTVNMIMSTSESDSEILAEIANAGAGSGNVMDTVRKVLGYDGYIVEGKYGNANVYVAFGSDQFKSFDNKTPTSSPDIHLELRSDENQFNPRKELSNLFMQIAQNEQEKKSLRSYQAAIHELNNTEIEISKLQQEMQGTDKLKSPQKYYELQNKLRQAEAKLNRYDGRLVQLEATKPMKDLIARREQRLKEQFARSSTTRAKYRNNIKKNIRSLDKKLRTNSGQKHVLLELQPVVAQLLNVFTENTSVFKKEQLARLREIYAKFNPEADSKMQATDNDVKRWKSTAEYSSAYSEMIYDLIEEVRPLVQGKRLIDLDTDLLAAVNDIVGNIKQKSAVSKSLPRRRFSVVDQSEHFTAKPPLKKYVFVRTSFGGGEGN